MEGEQSRSRLRRHAPPYQECKPAHSQTWQEECQVSRLRRPTGRNRPLYCTPSGCHAASVSRARRSAFRQGAMSSKPQAPLSCRAGANRPALQQHSLENSSRLGTVQRRAMLSVSPHTVAMTVLVKQYVTGVDLEMPTRQELGLFLAAINSCKTASRN